MHYVRTAIDARLTFPRDVLLRWIEAERGRFVPWLAVCMGAGVVAYFARTTEPVWWSGLAASALAVLGVALARHTLVARGVAICGLVAALGFAAAQLATGRAAPAAPLPAKAVVLTATVRGVEALPEGRRLMLDGAVLGGAVLGGAVLGEAVQDASVQDGAMQVGAMQVGAVQDGAAPIGRSLRVRLKPDDPAIIASGDTIQLRALLRPPAPPAYPGAWDLQRDAYFHGLAGYGTALGMTKVTARQTPGVRAWLQGVRDGVAGRVMAGIPGPAGAVAATLLTGGTAAIPATDRAAFRDSGLAHLLAVAGLHIGIVMGLFIGVTRFGLALSERAALFWPCKSIAALSGLAGGGVYLVLTGGHLPILRSFMMASLVTLGLVLGRRAMSVRGWALAAVGLMLALPNEVVGVGFQMSFSAVLALIAGYEALRPWLTRLYRRRALHHVTTLALTSLLAGTASAPYAAYHFGHFQLYFILANLLAVPLTALWVLPAGLVALLLMPFGLEQLALVPMGYGVDVIIAIARGTAALPAATVALPAMPGWGLGVFTIGLGWLCLWRTRLRLVGIVPMLAGLLSPLLTVPPDVLLSSDGRLIALHDGGYWAQDRGGAAFTRGAWEDHLANGPIQTLVTGRPALCGPGACDIVRDGQLVRLVRGRGRQGACDGVSLLISAEPARGVCPRGVPYLDRFSVWRDGAHAVWIEPGGVRVISDRQARGDRPWVPPLPVPRPQIPALPMATPDEGTVAE